MVGDAKIAHGITPLSAVLPIVLKIRLFCCLIHSWAFIVQQIILKFDKK